MKSEVNKELVKIVSENPYLPIKVFISGECHDEGNWWFVGEVYACKVTEIAGYQDRIYEKDDFDIVVDFVFDDICDFEEYENLSIEEIEKIAKEKAENLGWEKCILIRVGV